MSPDLLPLRVSSLCYAAGGAPLLDRLSFTLDRGPPTVILGPNGAGKSLLLRLCHGLLTPTAGRIEWNDGGGAGPGRHALVFQRPVMLRRSVAANIDYALGGHRLGRAERRRRVEEALRLGGLEGLAGRSARVLSGGEQQRLALARAWVMRPEIIYLDEPTSALDPAATYAVEQAVQDFHAAGTTVVMSTHDLSQARRLADEVLFLCRGRLLEHVPASAFFEAPASAEARAFLAGELVW